MTVLQNIFIQYLAWYFYDQPGLILRAWKNFLLFNLNYFSVPVLLKTFFSPWRRYTWQYPRGFDPVIYAEVFFSNLISRSLGAMMRIVLIIIGILIEIIILVLGAIIFLGWIFLPILLIICFYLGFEILK